jgi:AcrR family transcriptional regulator
MSYRIRQCIEWRTCSCEVGVRATAERSRSARREATRERVLDAAREVFAERGVIGASVEDICGRAGFTRGAFYSNFADKAELLDALIRREQGRLVEDLGARLTLAIEATRAGALDQARVFNTLVDQFLQSIPWDRQFTLVQTELEIHAIRDPAASASWRESDRAFRDRLARFIADAAAFLGRELLVDPGEIADAAMAIVARSVRRSLLRGDDDPDAMAREVLPGFFLGVSRAAPGTVAGGSGR